MIRYIVILLLLLVDGIDSEMVCQHFNVTFNNRRTQQFTEAELASPDLLVYINVPRQKENEPFVFDGGNANVVMAHVLPGDTLEIYYEFNQRILLGEILVSMESYIDPNEKIKIDISGVTYWFSDSLTFHNKFDTPIMVSNLTIYSDSVVPGTVGTSSSKDYRVQDITFPRVCSVISKTSSQSNPATAHVQSSSVMSTGKYSKSSFSTAHVQSSSVASTGKYSKSSLATSNLQSPSIFSTTVSIQSSQNLLSVTSSTTATTQTSSPTPTLVSQKQLKSGKLVGRVYVSGKEFHDKKLWGQLIRIEKRAIAVSHCMLEHCDKHSECVAINYNKETKECELLSSKYSKEQNQLVSSPGWKYHEAKDN